MDELHNPNTEKWEASPPEPEAAPAPAGAPEVPVSPDTAAPADPTPPPEAEEVPTEQPGPESAEAAAPQDQPPEPERPNPFRRQPDAASPFGAPAAPDQPPRPEPTAAPRKCPFFSDTWQIFKRMFSSSCGRILELASTDDHPIWIANLIVCLGAILVAALLILARWLPFLPVLYSYLSLNLAPLLTGGVIGTVLSVAAAYFLLIVAVKVLLNVLHRPASFVRVANVVTSCLLVNAAFVLAGGILGLVFPSLAMIGLTIGESAVVILVYVGVKKFLEEGQEPVWPYLWTSLIYHCAAGFAAVILLLISIGGPLIRLFTWYF